jgi:hypothetical protein
VQTGQDVLPCRADRAPRQGNKVEITDPRDVIPGGQGTGHQQIGHPAKAVQPFGKMTDDRRQVAHPASLRNPEGTGKSPMQTRQMAGVSRVVIVDSDAVTNRSRERNKQS